MLLEIDERLESHVVSVILSEVEFCLFLQTRTADQCTAGGGICMSPIQGLLHECTLTLTLVDQSLLISSK